MKRRIAVALLLAWLIPACAGSLWIPRSQLTGWHAARAGDTRLIGDLPPDEMGSLAGQLARFEAAFAKLAGRPETGRRTPLAIYLFRNSEIATRFEISPRMPGGEFSALDRTFIEVGFPSGRDQDRAALLHLYTHVLLERNQRTPLPSWYREGLAGYFSTLSERDAAVVVGAVPGILMDWLARHHAMPLDRLFAYSTFSKRRDETLGFYATSWVFSHYLLSSVSGRRELAAFVEQLDRGIPSSEAQPVAFGRSLDQLDEELAAHVANLSRGVALETLIEASEFASPDPPSVVALEPGEVVFALGSLALALVEVGGVEYWEKGPDLACSLFTMALAEDAPDAPRVEAALGEARAWSGDAEGAQTAVQSALARAPNDPDVRLRAARVALLRAEKETASGAAPALAEAEQQYLSARALAPESASAWFGLGQTLVQMGRPKDALAAFEAARRFGWSPQLDVALARLQLDRGETEQATVLLRPIAQDRHRGPGQEEAAKLLEQTHP